MKHSELRHQPRHVNPRIQDTCVTIMFCKICLWGNCTLHRVKSVREKVCIKAK